MGSIQYKFKEGYIWENLIITVKDVDGEKKSGEANSFMKDTGSITITTAKEGLLITILMVLSLTATGSKTYYKDFELKNTRMEYLIKGKF